MLKKILSAFGIRGTKASTSSASILDGPYKEAAPNLIYQLLFCDHLQLFKNHHKGDLVPPWSILFSKVPNIQELARIAGDEEQESRIRILAYNALRAAGNAVPQKVYLGTIIEVRLPAGLDTLAVFADGRARYINHSGKIAVVEGSPNPFDVEIKGVVDASKPIIAAIGPWENARLPAPKLGNIRMTFLVSDGLYFGDGPMNMMQQERIAAPLISAATTLLMKLVERTTNSNPNGSTNGG